MIARGTSTPGGHASPLDHVASGFAVLLFGGSVLNWTVNPTRVVLEARDGTEYVATPSPARTSV